MCRSSLHLHFYLDSSIPPSVSTPPPKNLLTHHPDILSSCLFWWGDCAEGRRNHDREGRRGVGGTGNTGSREREWWASIKESAGAVCGINLSRLTFTQRNRQRERRHQAETEALTARSEEQSNNLQCSWNWSFEERLFDFGRTLVFAPRLLFKQEKAPERARTDE